MQPGGAHVPSRLRRLEPLATYAFIQPLLHQRAKFGLSRDDQGDRLPSNGPVSYAAGAGFSHNGRRADAFIQHRWDYYT